MVLLFLAVVAYPVSRVISRGGHPVTTSASDTGIPSSSANPSSISGTLSIRTAPVPLHIEVTYSGKTLLQANQTNDSGEVTKQLSLPSGSELIVKAEWSDNRAHALHAEFLSNGTNSPIARDYWSGRNLEDVLSLP
jgi:hypothetical protein